MCCVEQAIVNNQYVYQGIRALLYLTPSFDQSSLINLHRSTLTKAMDPQQEPIAIVGSGCRFPGSSSSPSALWDLLQKPKVVSKDIPAERFELKGYYHPKGANHGTTNVKRAYLLDEDYRNFDAGFFNISPNEAESMDPQQRLLIETVYEAMEAGGHSKPNQHAYCKPRDQADHLPLLPQALVPCAAPTQLSTSAA